MNKPIPLNCPVCNSVLEPLVESLGYATQYCKNKQCPININAIDKVIITFHDHRVEYDVECDYCHKEINRYERNWGVYDEGTITAHKDCRILVLEAMTATPKATK